MSCAARIWEGIYEKRRRNGMEKDMWKCSGCGTLNDADYEYCKCGRKYDATKDKWMVVK